jgi:hypothetical protein
MINKVDELEYTLECDTCGYEAEDFFTSFREAVEYKKNKDNGWRSFTNKRGEWEDACPDCVAKFIKKGK